jgi:putative ABC transport system permease protein
MLVALLVASLASSTAGSREVARPTQQIDSLAQGRTPRAPRTIAIDERLAADARLRVGDRLLLSSTPGGAGDTVLVGAITRRPADPAEVARGDYRIRMHLNELQSLIGYGDRVDRFAVATRDKAATDTALRRIDAAAFGFQAFRSRDVAVETSQTFLVVSRFHRAIGVITVVASATFLLCIMLLKVDERRRDVAALRLMGISSRSIVRSVMVEAALVALVGSGVGVAIGWVASLIINWHYRGVYRTPLAFAIVTPNVIALAVALSVVLGLAVGFLAAQRLVRVPPLELLTGRHEPRRSAEPATR